MEPIERPRRRALVGPMVLIFLGLLFLAFNFLPDFDPWPVLARYWPLILIFMGLGKIWDYYQAKRDPDAPRPSISGAAVALVVLFVLLIAGSWHARGRYGHWHGLDHDRSDSGDLRDTQQVELGAAKSVSASLEMPSGMLSISGDSPRLLDADFSYEHQRSKPKVDYTVAGDRGDLHIAMAQDDSPHVMGAGDADWNLRFGGGVPLDLKIDMGAGESDVRLNGVDVRDLDLEMGAGELNLDLTGARKGNLTGKVEGGAGTATIRLPKDVGVQIKASGGLGSVTAAGLTRDGDTYTNDAFGKTPTSIDLDVEGGVGQIRLELE